MTPAKYRVFDSQNGWSVTAPSGSTTWSGAPSQPAAYGLARSMAGIDAMLARINRPKLAVVPRPARRPKRRPKRRDYGFGPVTPRRTP